MQTIEDIKIDTNLAQNNGKYFRSIEEINKREKSNQIANLSTPACKFNLRQPVKTIDGDHGYVNNQIIVETTPPTIHYLIKKIDGTLAAINEKRLLAV